MFNAGVRGKRAKDGVGFLSTAEQFNQKSFLVPTVTSFSVTNVSYVPLDDTAVDTSGGQTIVINGSGFASGATVQVGATTIGSVTFIDQNRLTFAAPALSSGSYTIYVTNSNGGTGILVSGLVYSGLPTYTTTAGSLGTVYETANINSAVVATGDAPITYTLLSGTLPSGSTLNSNGTITGNAPIDGSSTTYSFTIQATDAQLQDSTRAFTLTINTDVLSWGLANNTVYALDGNAVMSNVTLSATSSANSSSPVTFAANTLPTGVALSGATIYGTPTVEQTVYSALTATATQTGRTAIRYVSWSVTLSDPYLKNTTSLLNTSSDTNTANTFISDSSINNLSVTLAGDTRPNNFNPYTPGYYSNFFDGTGDYLTPPVNTNLALSTLDFTLECWINASSGLTDKGIFEGRTIGTGTTGFTLTAFSTTSIRIYSGSALITSGSVNYVNTWCHVAVVRLSGTTTLYINGASQGTTASLGNLTDSSFVIGAGRYMGTSSADAFFTGYISNFRIVKGTAVYTANFTPSTAPLTAIANTSLLTCQSNRFIDNSLNNFVVTKGGDTTVSGFTPFTPPTSVTVNNLYSTYFDGTGDNIYSSVSSAGTGSFTYEAWVYPLAFASNKTIFRTNSVSALDISLLCNSTGQLLSYDNSGNLLASTTTTLQLNTWTHVALVRNGTAIEVYINGNASRTSGTGTFSNNITFTQLDIGGRADGAESWNGYISNARYTKSAVYTSTFTPATTNLTAIANTSLLTCQNSTIIDNSNNVFTITSTGDARPIAVSPFTQTTTAVTTTYLGSGYIDGTGDYLSVANAVPLQLGTGNFTIEFWWNGSASGSFTQNIGTLAVGFDAGVYRIGTRYNSTNYVYFSRGNGTAFEDTTYNVNVNDGAWHHIACVRTSGVIAMYVDGTARTVSVGSASISGTCTFSNPLVIGYNQRDAAYSTGYTSNARIVKGTAVYTANFDPPVQPLTAVANTSLLTLQTNQPAANKQFVDNSGNNLLVTQVGNATQGAFSPYGANWSNYFDGTGDYIQTADNTALQMGTSTFTIEFWINFTSIASYQTIISKGYTSAGSLLIQTDTGTGRPVLYSGSATPLLACTGSAATVNTWIHYALVRNGTALTWYTNGVATGTTTNSTNISNTEGMVIGTWGGLTYYLNGYLSNLRIVKGTAVYTAAFTPPTTPLTPITNTSLLTCQSPSLIDNSSNAFAITKNGDTSVQRFSPFSPVIQTPTTYSNYVDTAYQGFNNSTALIGATTTTFTAECWIYMTAAPASGDGVPCLIGMDALPASSIYLGFGPNASRQLVLRWFDGASKTATGGTALALNTWYHIAVVSNSNSIAMYVNGVAETLSGTTTLTNRNGTAASFALFSNSSASAYQFKGYASNIRVTTTAVYTSAFTPSTTPLTAITGTVLLTCQSATQVDNSTNNYALTQIGTTSPRTFNPFGVTNTTGQAYTPALYGGSAYFDGTGDILTIPSNEALNPNTGAFTIEMWIYPLATVSGAGLFTAAPAGADTRYSITYYGTTGFGFARSTAWIAYTSTVPAINSWSHLAVSRDATGAVRLFLNGVAQTLNGTANTTVTDTGTFLTTAMQIGYWSGYFNGYISNVRMVKGTQVYTGNFVPPTTPLTAVRNTTMLLSMDKAAVTDVTAKSNFETVGDAKVRDETPYAGSYYSNYFDGTGDYLSLATGQTPLALSNSDFTVEAWVYRLSASTGCIIIGQSDNATAAGSAYVFYVSSSATSDVYGTSFPGGGVGITSPNPTLGTWAHVAWVRTGGTYSSYLNGVRVGTASTLSTNSINVGSTANPPCIGSATNGNALQGYISNLRLIKGSGGYNATSSTITIPTAPLTAIANTSLLTCQSRSFIDNSASPLTITRNGDVAVKSQNPFRKNSGSSIYFDGTGDWLTAPYSTGFTLGTGDFTIESWVNPNSGASNGILQISDVVGGFKSSAYTNSVALAIAASNAVIIWANGTSYTTSTNKLPFGVWTHLAMVRSSGVTKLYINGVLETSIGTAGSITDTTNYAGTYAVIGAYYNTTLAWNGYIADLRITKSARYTTTFTPTTSAFKSY